MQVFTANGTFTVPSGITRAIVEVVGGGGGGGRSISDNSTEFATGGGGGGFSKKIVTSLTPGGTVSVTVGTGGAKAASGGTAGTDGGTSSFGSHASASGGTGGSTWIDGLIDGGVGSNGDVNLSGGFGESHSNSNLSYGGASQYGVGGIAISSSIHKDPTGYGSGGHGGTYSTALLPTDGKPGIVIVYY
jgi:hypothetical protein